MVNNKWHKPDIIKLPNAREERAEVGSEEVLLSPNICLPDTVCLVAKLGPTLMWNRKASINHRYTRSKSLPHGSL